MPESAYPFGPDLDDAEKARLLDEIAEHLPLCINVQDPGSGKFVYVSREWEELTGLPVQHWLDDPEAWLPIIHPEDRGYAQELADEGNGRYATSRDVRILHQNGEVHWVHGWLAPVVDATGNVRRVLGISIDVTDRKKTEGELRTTHLALEQKIREQELELRRLREELSGCRGELGRSSQGVEAGLKAFASLTPREREVFERIVGGATNPSIANEFGIAVATVKVHRGQIMRKFDVSSFAALVATAVRCGIAEEPTKSSAR